jgi:hypothetical protein
VTVLRDCIVDTMPHWRRDLVLITLSVDAMIVVLWIVPAITGLR